MGVLGAGTMAPGIAAAFAGAGHPVRLWARSAERARAAAARARELAAFLVEHRLAASPAAIEPARELEELSGAGVVVEAIAESLDAKQDLFGRVEAVVGEGTLLASTTSGLRVADLAARVRRPERVVAMHFWNPAHLMPLVEVAGERASRASIDRAMALSRAIGKVPVLLEREVLGFLGVRLQQAVVREAIALVEAGVASAEDIDLAVRTSFGIRFPVIGPLESADLTGLDVIEAIHGYLLADLDRSTEPQAALRSRVAAGDLGSKSGRGFHDWTRRDAAATMRARDDELVRRLQRELVA
ncbi:MAG TPA: 3-hydroxyacyl-CoA dehydrogenase NAD-binding domain-containing protein [Solirubrobacter sp.]|nr:3-hydroxyacyl-CoA dehydrogenase NAD-binding domain-containing protein [Solirubrobacter sp.]